MTTGMKHLRCSSWNLDSIDSESGRLNQAVACRGGWADRGRRTRAERSMREVALVGLGAWGLCVLERIAHLARSEQQPTRVHVVEPAPPGPGVYSCEEPEYLLLNTPCGQISLYPWDYEGSRPRYGLGLFDWATQVGYRWNGEACQLASSGREITPHDYLPRRVLGAYLQWFYETLVEDAQWPLEIVQHRTLASDIIAQAGGRETVHLANGESVTVDHVILTTGHVSNLDSPDHLRRPYPVSGFLREVSPSASVGVVGMGLVGIDVISALTLGRGGSYEQHGQRLRYRPSGHEPLIYMFSRSGFPYCAKAAEALDETDDYAPVLCTPQAVAAIRADAGQIDIRSAMLPLIFAEMTARYYIHSASVTAGALAGKEVRARLELASLPEFETAVAPLAARYGTFDAERSFFCPEGDFLSAADYEGRSYAMIERDLDEALKGPASAVKAAYEVLRFQRDPMRSVIEFGGLSLESYLDFQSNIRSKVSRLVAGPPAIRSQQLLALMDAGTLRMPFGPTPRITTSHGTSTVRSAELDRPFSAPVDLLIQGYLEDPSLNRSSSVLLSNLYRSGRLQQFSYGDTPVGSVMLTEDLHPVARDGKVQDRLFLLSALTEGVRYFTHYLPSPKSRLRVFLDAQRCVETILA